MKTTEMKKNMGVMSAISIVVGCVIGAGVFFKPYAIYQATGGAPGLGLLSWLIGGLVSIFGALTLDSIFSMANLLQVSFLLAVFIPSAARHLRIITMLAPAK